MKIIFAFAVVPLFAFLDILGQVNRVRERCEITETLVGVRGWAQYYDSPQGKIGKDVFSGRQIGNHGGFVVESTRFDSRNLSWAEISHWTEDGRKRLGWVQAKFLKKCVTYKKMPAEEEWLRFFAEFKFAVESGDLETLQNFLPPETHRELSSNGGQKKMVSLRETLIRGQADVTSFSVEEPSQIYIRLIRRTDRGGARGYGSSLSFYFIDGKWIAEFQYDSQISGPG